MEITMARLNLIAPRFSTLGLLEGIRSVAEDEAREAERLRTLSLIETQRLNQENARIQNNILRQTGLETAEGRIALNNANIENIGSQITTRAGQLTNNTNNINSQITTRAGQLTNDTNNINSQITTRAGQLGVSQGNLGVAQANSTALVEQRQIQTELLKIERDCANGDQSACDRLRQRTKANNLPRTNTNSLFNLRTDSRSSLFNPSTDQPINRDSGTSLFGP